MLKVIVALGTEHYSGGWVDCLLQHIAPTCVVKALRKCEQK